jgi:regulator of protease activity HflC (stomatin/prohibitin superfamily)
MQSQAGQTQIVVIALLLAILAVGGFFVLREVRGVAVNLETPYQAVLLANGQAYFGKLQGLGSAFPVLIDVHYVQTQVNQETKQTTNILVRRGKEWHGPDRMILNGNQIVLVEPVTEGSQVAKLIAELRGK